MMNWFFPLNLRRFYSLALQKNFLYGRRQMHVVAVVLYIVCRLEKSPHLLIDFSDACQVNVYKLGHCFLQCIRVLNIQMPIIDPSLYIHRYAQQLDLGEKVNNVIHTALRTVTRLKKDWIHFGRRPDGVCAAALLIASRAHGFHKSQSEIAALFRVADSTIKTRLIEFRATPAAHLPISAFHGHEIENEAENDPPAFIRNKKREDDLKRLADGETEEEVYGITRKRLKMQHRTEVRKDLYENIYSELATAITESSNTKKVEHRVTLSDENDELVVITSTSNVSNKNSVIPLDVNSSITGNSAVDKLLLEAADVEEKGAGGYNVGGFGGWGRKELASMRLQPNSQTFRVSAPSKDMAYPNTGKGDVTSSSESPGIPTINEPLNLEDDVIESFVSNDDMSLYVLSAEEQRKKSAIWERMHRPYLEEREKKRQLREREAAQREHANIVAAQTGQSVGRRRKYTRQEGAAAGISIITSAATMNADDDEGKRTSTKINYEALQNLFDDEGQFKGAPALGSKSQSKKDNNVKASSSSSTATSLTTDTGTRRPLDVPSALSSITQSQRDQSSIKRPKKIPKQAQFISAPSQSGVEKGKDASNVPSQSVVAAPEQYPSSSPPDENESVAAKIDKVKKTAQQNQKKESEASIASIETTHEEKSANDRARLMTEKVRKATTKSVAAVDGKSIVGSSRGSESYDIATIDKKKAVPVAIPISIPGAGSGASRFQNFDNDTDESGELEDYDDDMFVHDDGDPYDRDED